MGHWHDPRTHEAPRGQARPQLPQLLASLASKTQFAPHIVLGETQRHMPVTQELFVGHAVVQLPQCIASVCVL